MRTVAIIPARGGSKGIPGKNVVDFCGKPLIAWSILQALAARTVSSVHVTSDSGEILEVAARNGAEPIVRPESISGDAATSESAWLHALDQVESVGGPVDLVLGMQATSPLREAADIDRAVTAFLREECDSMFSCGELSDHFIWRRASDGAYESLTYDFNHRARRQDVETAFLENGSFYLFKPEILRQSNNRLGGKIGIVKMASWKCHEIDTMEDMEFCEYLMKKHLLDG